MPYIDKQFRLNVLVQPIGPGELDYQLTMCVIEYLNRTGHNFLVMNSIVGVLDNVKNEFQRRIMHPYEDKKKELNGDVYDSLR